MADWTTLPNTAVGVGGLPSGTTVTALRDNPVAIAEGAPGAPKVMGEALGVFRGSQTYTGSATPATFTGIGRANELMFKCRSTLAGSTGNTSIGVQFSNDGGSTWSTRQDLFVIGNTISGATDVTVADVYINTETGAWWGLGFLSNDGGVDVALIDATGTLTPLANANAIRFLHSSNNGTGRVHMFVIGGRA
jgi:hypothetical protein